MKYTLMIAFLSLGFLNTSIHTLEKSSLMPVTKTVAKAGIVASGYLIQKKLGRNEPLSFYIAIFMLGIAVR